MKNKNIRIIDATADDDRISQLPEFILHHILSFLLDAPGDLLRMSVLSNYWFYVTASFPIFSFFIGYHKFTRESFFKYVDYTTSRFSKQNVTSAHTLKLKAVLRETIEIDIIDKCLGLIFNRGLQVLDIDIGPPYANHVPFYRVPNLILSSASSLRSLTLRRHCELPSSLVANGVKFRSLKRLQLQSLSIEEEVIKGLTTSCPLLEKMYVQFCSGFKRFCVYGHQNLKKLVIFFEPELEIIDVEAPNLWYLFLMGWKESKRPSLNFALCKNLTTLYYYGHPSPRSRGLVDFSSNFPSLETLYLNLPDECNNLNLSSHSLRTFVLHSSYCDLDEIVIKAPNLLSFDFKGHSHSRNPVARNSTPSTTRMECYPEDDVDSLWFQKLRRFLGKKVSFKELKLWVKAEDLIDVEAVKVIQCPPFELEHVDLELDFIKQLSVYLSVVEAVLWCCRPRSLTLESYFPSINFEEWSHIVKFTYKKLLEQEDERKTNIQIELASSSKPKKHFSNMNSLLTSLPSDRLTQTITFIKEKRIREHSKEYISEDGSIEGIGCRN